MSSLSSTNLSQWRHRHLPIFWLGFKQESCDQQEGKGKVFCPNQLVPHPCLSPQKVPHHTAPPTLVPSKSYPSPAPSPQKAPHEKVPLPLKTPLSPRSMGRKFCCRCGSISPTHPSLSSRNFQRLWDFMTGPMGPWVPTWKPWEKYDFANWKSLHYGFTVKLGWEV